MKEPRTLYPPVEPYQNGWLRVSDLHEVYYEQSGKPDGVPVVFLHGGPGVGTYPKYRQFFDPEYYRIILFDQRGCGLSRPLGCLEDNNTEALAEDIETLRNHLNIDKWIVFGGSWGSTLALVYAIRNPDRVKAMVLRGIFLARQQDNHWLFEDGGAAKIFPDYFENYRDYIPEEERDCLVEAYYKRLICEDENIVAEAATRFSAWETKSSRLIYDPAEAKAASSRDIANSRIEAWYIKNNCFFPENYILDNLSTVLHIPTYIVHGRYDIVCSASNAWELVKTWKSLSEGRYCPELVYTPASGHSQMETENIDVLVTFMDRLKL